MHVENKKSAVSKAEPVPTQEGDQKIKARYGNMQWTLLVTDGHVILRRVNYLAERASILGVLVAGSFTLSIALALGAFSKPAESTTGWAVNPAGVNEWIKGMTIAKVTPAFGSSTKSPEAYKAFIAQVIQNDGALSTAALGNADKPGCVSMNSLSESWLNPATGLPDRPRCKVSEDGKTIWLASFVLDQRSGQAKIFPTLGALHKDGGRWAYFNFDAGMPGALYSFPEFQTVSFAKIPARVAADFPEAMTRADLSQTQGWLARARKAVGQ